MRPWWKSRSRARSRRHPNTVSPRLCALEDRLPPNSLLALGEGLLGAAGIPGWNADAGSAATPSAVVPGPRDGLFADPARATTQGDPSSTDARGRHDSTTDVPRPTSSRSEPDPSLFGPLDAPFADTSVAPARTAPPAQPGEPSHPPGATFSATPPPGSVVTAAPPATPAASGAAAPFEFGASADTAPAPVSSGGGTGAGWAGYAGNPQHTAISPVASQSLDRIRWQTPVDLNPQYSGSDLLIHYGSPLVTTSNTVIVPVKTGTTGGYRLEAHSGRDGTLLWTQTTDYLLPPHDWTPSVGPTLTPANRLYYPGAGGTVYEIDQPDAAGTPTVQHLAFYGIGSYSSSTFDNSVFINTPITSDAGGNIYFGFQTVGTAPLGLHGGIARIDPAGNGTWVAAGTAAADNSMNKVVHNSAPALSNDGTLLYVAVSDGSGYGFNSGYLLALNSSTLVTVGKIRLKDPGSGFDASLADDGTSSPTVGPDGDVYFGVLENPFATSKGWLLHFSYDLTQIKSAPGAFGWDDTAAIVPSSMVASYTGNSPYLLMTKYNNYADTGGDGVNKLAVLDPNDSQVDARSGVTVMKEVLTIAGVTPDPTFIATHPNAVREWCINTAAVDPSTDSVLVNSEDGRLYRWDLAANRFTQSITLAPATGEAYTPTLVGVDGTVYAINNATLFAVQRAAAGGPYVTTQSPGGGLTDPVGSVRVRFNDPIDPTTFTTGSIHSFTQTVGSTATDLLGTITGVAPVPGTGNTQFDIAFASQSATGDYQMVIGPDIRDLAGHPMDQNGNGTPGEVPGDQYTIHFAIQGPKILGSAPSGTSNLPGQVRTATLTFNEAMDPSTLNPSTVFVYAPDSTAVVSVTPVPTSGNKAFTVAFTNAWTASGWYTLLVSPAVQDAADVNYLDQNGNFVGGESPDDYYVASTYVVGPQVVATTPADGSSSAAGQIRSATVRFNEAINPASFDTSQVYLFGPSGLYSVQTPVPVSGSGNTRFTVPFASALTDVGTYYLVFGTGYTDTYGNSTDQGNYFATFTVHA